MTSTTRIRYRAASFLLAGGLLAGAALIPTVTSGATNSNPGVCAGTHISPPDDNTKVVVVTAPEGKLISGYCVKAGSINQGLGPEYVTVNPPKVSVSISHSSGKDISHYTVTYVDKPEEETTTTTVPEEETTTTTEGEGTTTTTVPGTTTTTEPGSTTTVPGSEPEPRVITPPAAVPVAGDVTYTG